MSKRTLSEVIGAVRSECEKAGARYGEFHSTHEGLGVLAEEIDELMEAIRSNRRFPIQREAIQVAAVAIRLADALEIGDPAFLDRSGFSG